MIQLLVWSVAICGWGSAQLLGCATTMSLSERTHQSAFCQKAPSKKLRVLVYNVLKGNLSNKIARDIRYYNPDIALLQEVDNKTKRSRLEKQSKLLAKKLKMYGFYAPSYRVDKGSTGQAILSRFPFKDKVVIKMPKSRNMGALATILWQNKKMVLVSTHFSSTYKPWVSHIRTSRKSRVKEARHMLEVLKKYPHTTLLGGDFNASSESLPLRILRKSLLYAGPFLPTYPASWPFMSLDHLFITSDICITRTHIGKKGVSDHRPVVFELGLRKK